MKASDGTSLLPTQRPWIGYKRQRISATPTGLVLAGDVWSPSYPSRRGIRVSNASAVTGTSSVVTYSATPGLSPVPIMSDDEIERTWRIAKALAASRVFKDVTQAEQAFAKILLGRDLGLSPAQSMNAMDFVKGNVMLRAVTLASFVRRSPRYDYHIEHHDDTKCEITFFSLGVDGKRVTEGVSSFTIEDAKSAKLVRTDSAWTAHPRNMLFARAMSNGVKWFAPDMLGGIPVYTEGDSFDDNTVLGTADEDVESTATLPDAVESVLARAKELGHDGLADRATAEMTVTGQSEEFVNEWCTRATEELDRMQQPDNDTSGAARARLLLDQATKLREQKQNDAADDLEDEAARLLAEVDDPIT